MKTSAVSFWTIRMIESHRIYTLRLAQKGELITHHKDKAVLTLLKIDSVIETDFLPVQPEMTLGDMVKVISKSHRNIFPVLDQNGIMLGIVLLDDIRNIMFRTELYDLCHPETHDRKDRYAGIFWYRPYDEVVYLFVLEIGDLHLFI